MDTRSRFRTAGLLAVLSGVLLTVACWRISLLPGGCVAAQCDVRPRREIPGADGLLLAAGLLLLVVSVLVLTLALRARGQLGRAGRAAGWALLTSVVLLAAGWVVNQVSPDTGEWATPFFVVPAFLAIVVGMLAVAVAVVRARVLPVWSIALLVASLVVLLFFNDENGRVLLAVPFALAWVAAGVVLIDRAPAVPHRPTAAHTTR